ncbi:alpha/beta fold hydrolase [Ramlibacter humi]|uniref:Alpha/beta hydrolase n=1 Tax=Ramlibacter humi TaxID=2530451 RepID=A0A4Z0CC52_9BURK|nr:alpha/beta hydrolase [Ramlibacter humi]TFZ08038.1 alpha/beta hydrolase [Ramlibacter humi]
MRRWLLLRGLARESGHWGGFASALARRTGEPVRCLDLPGNGELWRERSPATVAATLACMRRSWSAGEEPTVVVAMSLGAMVALEWARTAPQELAGCVLINTSAGGASWPWQRLQPHNWPVLGRLALPGLNAVEREQRVLRMTSARSESHAGAARGWAVLARQHPVAPGNAVRQLWAAARWSAPRQAPAVPIVLLASQGDRLVSPECSRRLAARWSLPLKLHPWAGHDLPLDDPLWVLREAAEAGRSFAR